MSKIEQDARLNRRLIHDKPGRRFHANDDARWGELILPAPDEGPAKSENGLRILAIASSIHGLRLVKTLVGYEQRHPERISLVGLVTDDPVNADARIGAGKRMWRYLDSEQRLQVETATVEAALCFGVPVYSGEIKVDWFRRQAARWRPDVILVCVFGQVIDRPIIELPSGGIYNFHPSDLAHHHGAGPAPVEELATRDARTTVWTVHQVSTEVDAGQIVGQSPPINVRGQEGDLPEDPWIIYQKMVDPLGYMTFFVIDALAKRHAHGEAGPLERLDFEELVPPAVKARFMAPIVDQDLKSVLGDPDPALFDLT
ncbi:MAG: formyltransferase family protein [Pseudomonadota bacterium]